MCVCLSMSYASVMLWGSFKKYISFLFKLTPISQGSNYKLLFVAINTQFSMLSSPFWKCPQLETSPRSMRVLEMKDRFCEAYTSGL